MALVITVQDRVIVRTLSRWSWVISTVWLNCELQTPLATNFYFTERDTMIWQKNISNFLKSSENKIGLWYDTSANRFDWISDWKYQIRHFYFFNNLNKFFAWCNYQNMLVLLAMNRYLLIFRNHQNTFFSNLNQKKNIQSFLP